METIELGQEIDEESPYILIRRHWMHLLGWFTRVLTLTIGLMAFLLYRIMSIEYWGVGIFEPVILISICILSCILYYMAFFWMNEEIYIEGRNIIYSYYVINKPKKTYISIDKIVKIEAMIEQDWFKQFDCGYIFIESKDFKNPLVFSRFQNPVYIRDEVSKINSEVVIGNRQTSKRAYIPKRSQRPVYTKTHLNSIRSKKINNFREIQNQRANYGLNPPIDLINYEISLAKEIEKLDQQIEDLQKPLHPGDMT